MTSEARALAISSQPHVAGNTGPGSTVEHSMLSEASGECGAEGLDQHGFRNPLPPFVQSDQVRADPYSLGDNSTELGSSSSAMGSLDVELGIAWSDRYVAQCGPTMRDENKVLTQTAVLQMTP